MYFQPSPLSRPRQAVDCPKVLNLRERNCAEAVRRARAVRLYNSQLARDHQYLNSIPYLESQMQTAPNFDDYEDSIAAQHTGLGEEEFYTCEDVSAWAEDLLLRCPTKVCFGRLLEVQSGFEFSYVCSERDCGVRLIGSTVKWSLFDLCEKMGEVYARHQFCGGTPAAFISEDGRPRVKCVCGFDSEVN